MNDLTYYNKVQEQLLPGDAIFFYGNAAISHIIEKVAGGPSHVAIVQEASSGAADVLITQSTIDGELNGVQSEYLGWNLANYGIGARAEWQPLLPEVRGRLNFPAFYRAISAATGKVHYDKTGLVLYALHDIFPFTPKPPEARYEMFCSAWATVLYQALGIVAADVDYRDVSPAQFKSQPLFSPAIKIL